MKSIMILALLAAASFCSAATETVLSTAGLAQPSDQVGVGARALAMGSAYVGVAEGSSTLMWNAAGLGNLKAMDLSLHHNSGLADSVQETLIFAAPLGQLGGFGAGFNYINNGLIEGRDASGNLTPDFNAGSLGFQLGWGREMFHGLSLGLAGKSTTQTLGDMSYSSFAGDISGLWEPLKGFRVGLNYANLGSSVGGYAKASELRLGTSLTLPVSTHQVIVAASTQIEPGGVSRLQLGAEGVIEDMVAIRAGYQLNLAEQGFEGIAGMTLGAGIKLNSISLDYAYLPFGDLGASQRISLSYEFNATPEPKVKAAPEKAPVVVKPSKKSKK